MRPQKIVFHCPSLMGGGAERVWVLVANELARRGHEVTLLVWNGEGPNAALRSDAVHLVDLGMPVINDGFGKPGTLAGLWRTTRFLRRYRPDAVFSAPDFANLVAAVAVSLSGRPIRFFPSFHAANAIRQDGFGSRLARFLSQVVGRRAHRAVAVSAGVGRDVVLRGIPASKVVVINNPLPPMLDRPDRHYPFEQRLAGLGDGPIIVTAGRLNPVKDQSTLLRGFAELVKTRPARLVIFGDGPLLSSLQAEAQQLGIAGRTLFAGYVNDPAACYRAADLFVLTSRTEGFGNVLVEAMAAGVPVVSTDCPHGPREILRDGALGPLVPVGDASALAQAMGQALDAPVSPDMLKTRAADFDVETIGDRYEALLER